jgi:hypothetical protein
MFDLISFRLEILQYSCFFNDIISKLFPLHIAIAIDVDLIEKISQVPNKGNIAIGGIDLPEFEMFFGNNNELFKVELIVFGKELFFEQLDCDFIEIKSHVGNHFVIGLLYVFVGRARGVDRVDFHHVAGVAGRFRSRDRIRLRHVAKCVVFFFFSLLFRRNHDFNQFRFFKLI